MKHRKKRKINKEKRVISIEKANILVLEEMQHIAELNNPYIRNIIQDNFTLHALYDTILVRGQVETRILYFNNFVYKEYLKRVFKRKGYENILIDMAVVDGEYYYNIFYQLTDTNILKRSRRK